MNNRNLSSIDLNLLVVLATVLEEGSATRAAARLCVTQSAVSNALRRLREVFNDPLLVRTARGLTPTPRAAELEPQLKRLLEEVQRIIKPEASFDPATTTRTFTVASTDGVGVALLPALLRLLKAKAPRARLRLLTLDRLIASDGLTRGEVDLLIGIPPVLPPGCRAEEVYKDSMQSFVRNGHPRVRRRLTLELFTELPHAELSLFGQTENTVDRALAQLGRSREVHVAVPHFSLLLLVVAESDCVATLSSRILQPLAGRLGLRMLTPPLELPTLRLVQVWHRRTEEDPGVQFLRRLVLQAAGARQRSCRGSGTRALFPYTLQGPNILMLDRAFFARYRVLPERRWEQSVIGAFRLVRRATSTRVDVLDFRRPAAPVIFASNSTQKYDFMPFRMIAEEQNLPVVTVTKAKNYHSPMRVILERTGVVPIASKGYLLAIDFSQVHGRRPEEHEYRALRRFLDQGEELPDSAVFTALQERARSILGYDFDPSRSSYRATLREIYRGMMAETVRLSREAVAAGFHIHMYPEGTVSSRLGQGRNGVVQLARALALPIVPLAMSGCREVFAGQSVMLRGGAMELRFGEAFYPDFSALSADFCPFDPEHERLHGATLQAATDALMERLDVLLWPSLRRAEGFLPDGTSGVRRFL